MCPLSAPDSKEQNLLRKVRLLSQMLFGASLSGNLSTTQLRSFWRQCNVLVTEALITQIPIKCTLAIGTLIQRKIIKIQTNICFFYGDVKYARGKSSTLKKSTHLCAVGVKLLFGHCPFESSFCNKGFPIPAINQSIKRCRSERYLKWGRVRILKKCDN